MKNLVKVILVGLLIFLFASVVWSKTEHNSTMDSGASLESLLGGDNTGGECDCIATYNFLTGILTIPCADVGAGNLYSLDLAIDNAGKSGNITLKLVDYSENTDCLQNGDSSDKSKDMGDECQGGEVYDAQLQKCVMEEHKDMNQGCSEGEYYDEQQQKCVQGETGDMNQECSEGEYYDMQLQKCVIEESGDIEGKCVSGEVYNEKLGECVVECGEGEMYNKELGECVMKCEDGQVYDKEIGECIESK